MTAPPTIAEASSKPPSSAEPSSSAEVVSELAEPSSKPQSSTPLVAEKPTRAVPERMAKLLQAREIWETNRASFYAWLDQTPEKALEPDLEIVDPHHHLWDMRDLKGFNLFGIFRQQYYMTEELLDDCLGGGHNVTHTVFAQAHSFYTADALPMMAPLGEVQMAQGIAAQFASGKYGSFRGAAGIIGSADLAQFGVEVESLLLACKAASPNYRGIRCPGQHDPNVTDKFAVAEPGTYSKPKFREGFALLAKHELVFDAWLFASQLPDLHSLATAFPDTTIVLDHVGTPVAALGDYTFAPIYNGKQEEVMTKWRNEMTRIAKECPNVNVKISGLAMPQLGHGLPAKDKPPTSDEIAAVFKEICLWTINTFGPERCMFASNFPVDKVSMSYTVLWNAYKRMTKDAGLSDAHRSLLFGGTAKRVYKL